VEYTDEGIAKENHDNAEARALREELESLRPDPAGSRDKLYGL
jgi:hypothetical protein